MTVTPESLLRRLDEAGYRTKTIRHPPLFTVADSKRLRGEISGRHTKNLFLKDKKDNFFLVTVGEDREINLKELHKVIGAASRVSFGKPDKLMEFLGVIPGAVSAFSVVNDADNRVKVVFDRELMNHDEINAHPLTNEATTTIRREDLIEFMTSVGHRPAILDVAS